MAANERLEKIVKRVEREGFLSTRELAETMNVTETTIRRDSEELERQGKVIKVHGGIKSLPQNVILSSRDEKTMRERLGPAPDKEAAAEKAASYIREGDCVFLDGGTSLVPVFERIKDRKVKIVTHSQLLARLATSCEAELTLLGGKYIPDYEMSVGPITLENLGLFRFDYAIIGCAGIDLETHAVYTAELETAAVKKAAMAFSVRKILLADEAKLHVKGFCSVLDTDMFDAIVLGVKEKPDPEQLPLNAVVVLEEEQKK
ncbi:DeoR/GlpR family DNA-binding transcription regulator [uncultured Dubosiella sp.]|uniref:DeoR/GlpR family DNA-binding transcription regulator n=1 Tax=uncultured Dubosiella sp. TaxID=1937011 RepID=UPI0025993517|nr:DeoR/GlpR family DNA-binding transcription regulator [uncultured Dubosiella sp.]